MNKQALFSIGGLLLLCLVVVTALHDWDATLAGLEDEPLTAPAIIANGVQAKAFSEEDGQLKYQLVTRSLTQYDHEMRTLVNTPVVTATDENGSWIITAEQGEVLDDGELIVFTGQASADNRQRQIRLDTEELRFLSKSNEVEAPYDATIQFESGNTRAGSLKAELDTGTLILKQGVKSEFAAPSS